MTKIRFGIIGGSGLYSMAGLQQVQEINLETPFGAPSDAIATGLLDGVPVAIPDATRQRLAPLLRKYLGNHGGV